MISPLTQNFRVGSWSVGFCLANSRKLSKYPNFREGKHLSQRLGLGPPFSLYLVKYLAICLILWPYTMLSFQVRRQAFYRLLMPGNAFHQLQSQSNNYVPLWSFSFLDHCVYELTGISGHVTPPSTPLGIKTRYDQINMYNK